MTGDATSETETGAETAKPGSVSALAKRRGVTDHLGEAITEMNRRCEMFDAWEKSCAASRPSSPIETCVKTDEELPKAVVTAMLAVTGPLRPVRMTSAIVLDVKPAVGRCRATATARPCGAARRGVPLTVHAPELATLRPGPCRWLAASSLLLNGLVEVRRTPT